MKVRLPERNKLKKRQLFIYISIMVVCIISIIIAFYVQFYARIDIAGIFGIRKENGLGKKDEEQIQILKAEFDNIFTNNIESTEDYSNRRKDDTKQLIYTDYEKKESKLNSYDIEVHIPYINIDNDIIKKYNEEISKTFKNKTDNVLKSENQNVIYMVEYVANVQDGILSLMIRSNLKEGSSAQRVIIQTYNYDLRNNKEITLEEALKIEQLDVQKVQNQIKNEIEIEQKKVEDLKQLGYNIYSRDTSSEIYNIQNSTEYYLTNNTLYIIYAYGNESFTSEMDLVVI